MKYRVKPGYIVTIDYLIDSNTLRVGHYWTDSSLNSMVDNDFTLTPDGYPILDVRFYKSSTYKRVSKSDILEQVKEKKEGWVNIYRTVNSGGIYTGDIHMRKENAVAAGATSLGYVDSVKIEWEE